MKKLGRLATVGGAVTALLLGLTATPALADEPAPVSATTLMIPSVSGIEIVGVNGVCHINQDPQAVISLTANQQIEESGTNVSTSDCNASELPVLNNSLTIEDLGAITHTTYGSKAGSGTGPVISTAKQDIPLTGEPGPKFRYTFVTTARSNTNMTTRICQQETFDVTGLLSTYNPNC